ncbi:hypothetical protein [Prochlorococcus marinus]|uniref:hypothetical protein n=1 Tax=Prochlorococcus marinus TaxID=1219 RepID=UPI001ADB2873|nr:hypothetical protein [Prochlorococcus marinus]MBO8203880.1 hypothetical protein [Prochlorococcus marinus CUG1415]MBW3043184.1 hypothetical protein [Prochlorococcus marinus str. MU1415]
MKNFGNNDCQSIFSQKLIFIISFFFIIFISTNTKQVFALSPEWVGVPKTNYGEQLWDKKSLQRNRDGSVRVISKFIPKNKSEITQDIMYTMDINCFEKSFRDVAVGTDQLNNSLNNNSDWQDPNGDQLILGVIGQVCNYKD